jgi:competence protein ComEC
MLKKHPNIPIWKTAPFLRILPPLIVGILLQWYLKVLLLPILFGIACFTIALLLFSLLPDAVRFKIFPIRGVVINLLWLAAGALLSWQKDIRHNENWYGNFYTDSSYIIATINEPVVEKTKSYKADAIVQAVVTNDAAVSCEGKILLYFSKDSSVNQLHYGDQILINKKLQLIKNSGNPGAFNYQRYAAFQQTFHNAFLKEKDWVKLDDKNINGFKQFIFTARENILSVLQKNITTGKDELGIAEALLIGYTNDLDKDLVQAYSNTGVVHIIAISGMHLGLIYVMLVFLFSKIPGINKSKWLQVVLILSCLWLFSLVTGGSASVLRSAVMFSFITVGRTFFKESSIFNSLAASAFVMLCYNPYYLWDVGFQLSYLAVVGIVIFQKPIYNLVYIKNKYVDYVWKMVAVTTAAQVLTFPVCIYYFHQFPLLFLITNLVAVPLSTIILYAEIFLVAFSWIPFVGPYLGKITGALVWLMNKIIININELPFAVWDKIPANVPSTWLLYAVVILTAAWLLNKNRQLLRYSLICLAGFVLIHGIISWQVQSQQKIIVYNVPQHKAIDLVSGNNYQFIGDSVLLEDGLLQNFHLKPGRIALQLNKRTDSIQGVSHFGKYLQFGNKRMLLIDEPVAVEARVSKIDIDLIVISKSPKLYIADLAKVFNCKRVVFDASNSLWKIGKWKEDCDKLNLRHHSIPEQGAFVLDVE